MSILNGARGWWTSRRQRARQVYAEGRIFGTAEEQEEIRQHRHKLSTLANRGMHEGTGTGPTGTPTDFTADQKRPRY